MMPKAASIPANVNQGNGLVYRLRCAFGRVDALALRFIRHSQVRNDAKDGAAARLNRSEQQHTKIVVVTPTKVAAWKRWSGSFLNWHRLLPCDFFGYCLNINDVSGLPVIENQVEGTRKPVLGRQHHKPFYFQKQR
jgi:hypothetical protein